MIPGLGQKAKSFKLLLHLASATLGVGTFLIRVSEAKFGLTATVLSF